MGTRCCISSMTTARLRRAATSPSTAWCRPRARPSRSRRRNWRQTTFTAGTAGSDDLFVNAWDGVAFSGPKEFHVNVVDNAPTVTITAPNQTASSGQILNASSLFSANDADGDSLLYFFYDNSAAATSGHFEINGVTAGGRHDLRGGAGATGADDLRRRNHGRRPVRECVGRPQLQRTEGVPHRPRMSIARTGRPSRSSMIFSENRRTLFAIML